MNIMIIMNSFNVGGSSSSMLRLAESLNKNILFVFLSFAEELFPKEKYRYVELKIPENQVRLSNISMFLKPVIHTIKKIKKVNSIDFSISALIVSNIVNCYSRSCDEIILTCHSNYTNVLFGLDSLNGQIITNAISKKIDLIRDSYNSADKIIAVSEGARQNLIKNFKISEKKTLVIPNFINIPLIKKKSEEEIEYQFLRIFDFKVIIHVGRLSKEKNQEGIIRVFKKMLLHDNELKLVLVGDGKEKDFLVRYSLKLGLTVWLPGPNKVYKNEDVVFLGNRNNPYKYISKSSVFVLASFFEGFGMVLIEALASGCSIVTVDCSSGPREIIAPGTSVEDKAKQPEITKYGVLMPKLCPDGSNDAAWVSVISYVVNGTLKLNKLDLVERSKFYDQSLIANEWSKIFFMGKKKILSIEQIDYEVYNAKRTDKTYFSICIPTYNRADYLKDAIWSCLNQDYDNYEVIVLDDGSTDNTKEVVESFKSAKIRYIFKKHSNAPDTRNKCIENAKGDYILWLDSDDLLNNKILSTYSHYLESYSELDVIGCNLIVFDDYTKRVIERTSLIDWHNNNEEMLSHVFKANPLRNPGLMIRKKVYDKLGKYNTAFLRAHDLEFTVRLAESKKFKVKLVPECLCYQRIHSDNISGRLNRIKSDFSYETEIYNNLLKKISITEIFSNLNWNNKQESDYQAYNTIIKRYLRFNQLNQAINYANQYIEKYPDDIKMHNRLSKITERKLNFIEQYKIFKQIKAKERQEVFIDVYLLYLKDCIGEKESNLILEENISIDSIVEYTKKQISYHLKNKEYLNSIYLHKFLMLFFIDNMDLVVNLANLYFLIDDYANSEKYMKLALSKDCENNEVKKLSFLIKEKIKNSEKVDLTKISSCRSLNNLLINKSENSSTQIDNVKEKSTQTTVSTDTKKLLKKTAKIAEKYINDKNYTFAIDILDKNLLIDPLHKKTARLLREIEKEQTQEYLTSREELYLKRLRETSYSDFVILQSCQFWNSFVVMNELKDYLLKRDYNDSKMDKDLISIIIPVYNKASEIHRTVNAVIGQTYKKWEMIIVDDGSTDNSWEIIENIRKGHHGLSIYTITQPNKGLSLARNIGFSNTKGKYVLFLDCGDEITPDFLEETYSCMISNPDCDWVYPITLKIGFSNRIWRFNEVKPENNFTTTRQPVTSLIKREMCEEIDGFDPDFQFGYEDWNFFVQAVKRGFKGKLLKKILFIYNREGGSMIEKIYDSSQKEFEAKKMLIQKNQECYKELTDENIEILKNNLRIPKELINEDFYFNDVSFTSLKKITVQFYVQKNVHWPIFENIYKYLKTRPEIDKIIICIPSLSQLIGPGGYEYAEKILNQDAIYTSHPSELKTDITFIASSVQGKVKGCGKVVNVGHGTISKGLFFSDNIWIHRENWVDLLCVPGKFAYESLKDILSVKVVPTGMPKLDNVFSKEFDREYLVKLYNLDSSKKIIVYAPTFNYQLSSVFDFAEKFGELHSEDYYILIKLHGSTNSQIAEIYRDWAQKYNNFIFIEDSNLGILMGGADIMISDVSSAFMEFMALDKPVVLYNNPLRFDYYGFNKDDIEWKWRDLATECNSFEELKYSLNEVLLKGDSKSQIRQNYALELFSDLEGKASVNIWSESLKIIKSSSQVDVATISTILVLTESNIFSTRILLSSISKMSRIPVEIILGIKSDNCKLKEKIAYLEEFHELVDFKTVVFEEDICEDEIYQQLIEISSGSIILLLKENSRLLSNFDFVIEKTFRLNPEICGLTGLNTLENSDRYYERFFSNPEKKAVSEISYKIIEMYKGHQISKREFSEIPSLLAFRKDFYELNSNKGFSEFISRLINNNDFVLSLALLYEEIFEKDFESIKNFWKNYYNLEHNKRISDGRYLLNYFNYPDLAERVWKDMFTNKSKIEEFAPFIGMSLSGRFYDYNYKKELLDHPALKLIYHNFDKHTEYIDFLRFAKDSSQNKANFKDFKKEVITDESPGKKIKILFYYFKNVHIPIFEPLLERFKEMNQDFDLGISCMDYTPDMRAGFLPEELKIIEGYNVPIFKDPKEFQPDVTLIADSIYSLVQGCGKIIHIGHGVISKGQYYTNTFTAKREEYADLVCVPGLYQREVLRRLIDKPIESTGLPKLDKIYNKSVNRDTVIKKYGLPSDKKYILYAPTFNDELSAIPVIKDKINEVLPDNNTLLLIKLHGSSKKEYQLMYRNLVNIDPRVIFVDELDVTPFLALADILISDLSSVVYEFAALDKPVILFNNPNWKLYKNYNPNDLEYHFRDIGCQVNNLEEMKQAVVNIYNNNDPFKPRRKEITDVLIANKNTGDASEKIINLIYSLMGKSENETLKNKSAV